MWESAGAQKPGTESTPEHTNVGLGNVAVEGKEWEPTRSSDLEDGKARADGPRRHRLVDDNDSTYGWRVCARCGVFEPFQDRTEECCWRIDGSECIFHDPDHEE